MTGSGGEPETYRYFLAWRRGGPPPWIRPAQWVLLGLWLAFSWWLLFGSGRQHVVSSYYHFHGIFAEEVALGAVLLPTWGQVTLALVALELWFQAIWSRCRAEIRGRAGGWTWAGRRGPAQVRDLARTPGGAWCGDGRRRWFVARGYVDASGLDWLDRPGVPPSPAFAWRRLASPLALLLVILVAGAYALDRPTRANRRARAEVYRAVVSRDAGRLAAAERAHPEFRPWARYLETLPSCDEAACLRAQIAARLELHSIGPEYAADQSTLVKLLILCGRSGLALKLLSPASPEVFDVAVRQDDPALAREALARRRPGARAAGGTSYALLLIEEGRTEEAWRAVGAMGRSLNQRTVAVTAVAAYLSGHCREAEKGALQLMSPDDMAQIRLEGEAPATGLGALLRYVKRVRYHGSYAVGLALLGDMTDARGEWSRAEDLARTGGIPGLLDTERVLLRRVSPGGPWEARSTPFRNRP